MITESKVTEIFSVTDDFCKEFEVEMAKNALASSPKAPKRRRKRTISDAEVITILICFHFNTYRNFMHSYLSCVCGQWRQLSPERVSYNRFVKNATLFRCPDDVPAARILLRMHRHQFC